MCSPICYRSSRKSMMRNYCRVGELQMVQRVVKLGAKLKAAFLDEPVQCDILQKCETSNILVCSGNSTGHTRRSLVRSFPCHCQGFLPVTVGFSQGPLNLTVVWFSSNSPQYFQETIQRIALNNLSQPRRLRSAENVARVRPIETRSRQEGGIEEMSRKVFRVTIPALVRRWRCSFC